jgi:predicted RNA-binding Zn ribbon-like protein
MTELVRGEDETLLLDLLNSTPVGDAGVADALAGADAAAAWVVARGGCGSPAEAAHLRAARDRLQQVIWGHRRAGDLRPLVAGARWEPLIGDAGLELRLAVDDEHRLLAVRAVLAWAAITRELPGRLRACANDECRLFLLDRTRANTARWCSMAICGNRMKARRHYRRLRDTS